MSELPNPVKRSIEKTVADWTALTDAVKTINLKRLRQNLKGEKDHQKRERGPSRHASES